MSSVRAEESQGGDGLWGSCVGCSDWCLLYKVSSLSSYAFLLMNNNSSDFAALLHFRISTTIFPITLLYLHFGSNAWAKNNTIQIKSNFQNRTKCFYTKMGGQWKLLHGKVPWTAWDRVGSTEIVYFLNLSFGPPINISSHPEFVF